MDAADLKIFVAVVQSGAMNRAALELNTVQSNVTTRIRHLEAELGLPLFYRNRRGVILTPAGHTLLPYAIRITRLLAEARHSLVDNGRPQGPLTIGSLETTAARRLSSILATYVEANPDVDLILRTGTTCELVADVLEHRLEGGFVCGPITHPELNAEPMFMEELVVVTPPSVGSLDELVRNRNLKMVVLRAGCSYRHRLESTFAARHIDGLRQLEFGTIDTVLGCVAAGFGVTLLPRCVVESAWHEGRVAIHQLPPAEAQAETVFIRRCDGFVSRALASLLDHARAVPLLLEAAE